MVFFLYFFFNQVSILRKSAIIRKADGSKPKFIGFFLAVEQTSTPPSDMAEVAILHFFLCVCVFSSVTLSNSFINL